MSENFKKKLWLIIFEADTREGKLFDVVLFVAILLSVLSVMLESVASIRAHYKVELLAVEWFFTVLFTVEYAARLYCVKNRKGYAFSFFGLVDILAILPTYLSLFFVGAQSLLVVRSFRLLRVFRIFKLTHYLKQANILSSALVASWPKITVFLVAVLASVTTVGAAMYLIEGSENGFTSIPKSIYWAIVTMTTVGFGDITPQTVPGQMLASVLMIMGYGVLAVPTGIVSVEIARAGAKEGEITTRACESCHKQGHDFQALFCKFCGHPLKSPHV